MKQEKITTSKGEFRVVDEKDYMVFHLMLTENGLDCISLKEITEKQAGEIVDETIMWEKHKVKCYRYRSYIDGFVAFDNAIESLHSLLESKGIHLFENPYTKEVDDNYSKGNRLLFEKAEEKTFYNPYIFKL